jgi:hypothetical protein
MRQTVCYHVKLPGEDWHTFVLPAAFGSPDSLIVRALKPGGQAQVRTVDARGKMGGYVLGR